MDMQDKVFLVFGKSALLSWYLLCRRSRKPIYYKLPSGGREKEFYILGSTSSRTLLHYLRSYFFFKRE